ncbi:hypothetical protein SAMN05428944_1779 [Streptomyces sp. 1222.5]|uniref:hypothetical protein n=1 Tax=unclassified Streptomyces TaxID=2593676 RepID=UPI0008951219|nr:MULTISPECIES: hypothetical protein [unclassified Streptomyces]PKW11014.1 hypothetical protein BX260_6313 [Streptomyces sp. 5112.2]SEB90416.1 hypothetical protein SAMN05428944_1779 [Streptomyces sp. 1222.5]
MPRTTDPLDGPLDDRGDVRRVLAVPVTLLTLVAAFFCWAALVTRPNGPWDDGAYAGVAAACLLTLAAAGAVTALWLFPSVRRAMGWAWAAPALTLAAVAALRLAWLD